jgi:hypothetical protein
MPIVDLDGLFRDELQAYMVDPKQAAAYLKTAASGVGEKRDLLAKLKSEREKVRFETEKCFELYQAGALNVEQFRARFQPLDGRKKDIEKEVPRLEAEIDALAVNELSAEHVMAEGRSFYDRWPKLAEDEKRQIVELFLRRIVVGKEDVTVELLSLPSFGNVADGQRTGRGSSHQPSMKVQKSSQEALGITASRSRPLPRKGASPPAWSRSTRKSTPESLSRYLPWPPVSPAPTLGGPPEEFPRRILTNRQKIPRVPERQSGSSCRRSKLTSYGRFSSASAGKRCSSSWRAKRDLGPARELLRSKNILCR